MDRATIIRKIEEYHKAAQETTEALNDFCTKATAELERGVLTHEKLIISVMDFVRALSDKEKISTIFIQSLMNRTGTLANSIPELQTRLYLLSVIEKLVALGNVSPVLYPGMLTLSGTIYKEGIDEKNIQIGDNVYDPKAALPLIVEFNKDTLYRMSNFSGDIFVHTIGISSIYVNSNNPERFIFTHRAIDNQNKPQNLKFSYKGG